MSKKRILLIVVISLLGFWLLIRIISWTTLLSSFKITTIAMSPALERGDHIMVSRLIKPKVGDIICYKGNYERDGKEHNYTHRLMAIEGDTIELKSGLFYRNGKCIDDSLNIKFNYYIVTDDIEKIAIKANIARDDIFRENDSTWISPLTFSQFEKAKNFASIVESSVDHSIGSEINYLTKDFTSKDIDNFDLTIVPAGLCFVMGDNRHFSADSRFIGFIPLNKIKAVVFYKH